MKQISQEEFEQYVEAIIRGDMSKAQVVKEMAKYQKNLQEKFNNY